MVRTEKTIRKLDGSGRRFEVVRLRRHAADELAGTIDEMMGGEKEKKQNSRPRYMIFGYGGYGSSRRNNEAKKDKFRVSADVEHNLLLLWCNEVEMQEVDNLLQKLGETTRRGSSRSTMRVMDVGRGSDRIEFLILLSKVVWS